MITINNNSISLPPLEVRSSAVTIGNFDGCHLGHQHLISLTTEEASKHGHTPIAFSFTPSPKKYFSKKANTSKNLFTFSQKQRAFEELGLEYFINQSFNEIFSRVMPENYYNIFLRNSLKASYIAIGDNFRFGYRRLGTATWLKKKGREDGIKVNIATTLPCEGLTISSTRVRENLEGADGLEMANKMLGRPYMLEGTILKDRQIGREMELPTANLFDIDQLIPRSGVYAGYVFINSKEKQAPITSLDLKNSYPAVFNIGRRPTTEDNKEHPAVEAHLLTGSWGDNQLYNQSAAYYFCHYLREEIRFTDTNAMMLQIKNDIKRAKQLLHF